jgi:GntR family transcriptional regulator/MocR family aminotransferase
MRRRPLGRPPSREDIGGLAPLREAIARYLRYARGVRCDAEQVVVVTGSQQALDLCARVLVNPGDAVALENPGYPEARRLFGAIGARVLPVAVDDEGLQVARLPTRVRLAIVTPSHQYPLGMALSLTRRLELLQWAQGSDRLIIENDYDSEFRYDGSPLPALQGLGDASRVVYIGTFSLSMFPALRIGYLVVPPALVTPFLQAKWHTDRHTPHLEQGALAEFIAHGHLARHIRRMRRVYRRRRDALLHALQARFGSRATVTDTSSGLHLVVRFDTGRVAEQARRHGVVLLGTAACYADASSAPAHEFLLRFSNASERAITEAVRRMASADR